MQLSELAAGHIADAIVYIIYIITSFQHSWISFTQAFPGLYL
jgi:hypothetical protein